MSGTLRETDLYPPLRDYLELQGYRVRAEVNGCDVVAVRDGELVVIEMKTRFTLALLMQATARHAITQSVYLAIPAVDAHKNKAHWNGIRRIVRRMQYGLIVVRPGGGARAVEIAVHPAPFQARTNTKKQRAVLREVHDRLTDGNIGGSRGRELLTAYRQRALHIAWLLDQYGPLSPKAMRKHGGPAHGATICLRNVYGWFDHPARGLYALTDAGRAALAEYPEVIAALTDAQAESLEEA